MTAWSNWDAQALAYQGDPVNKETLAVMDAFQHVEGHGGDYNWPNIFSTTFGGTDLTKPPYSAKRGPYGLDFASPAQGVPAAEVVGENNWPTLLSALKTGRPLSYQWEIHQGASTPDPQYTAEVRSLAQSYLSGASKYDLGDTSLNQGGTSPTPPSGTAPPNPSAGTGGCDSDPANFVDNGQGGCYWWPAGTKHSDGTGANGTMKNGACCVSDAGAGLTQPTASGCGPSLPIIGNIFPQAFCDFFSAITSQAFWIRAGEIVLGLVLLAIGLRMAIGKGLSSSPVQAAAKAAAVSA